MTGNDWFVDTPELFFARDNSVSKKVCGFLTSLHSRAQNLDDNSSGGLDELLVEGCDSEQIWQQLNMGTDTVLDQMSSMFDEEDESTSLSPDNDEPPPATTENGEEVDLETSMFLGDGESDSEGTSEEEKQEEEEADEEQKPVVPETTNAE